MADDFIRRSDVAVFFENSKQTMWHKDDIAATISSKKSIPAANVVEVIHGEWKVKPNAGGYEVCMKCSVCGFQFDNWQHIFKYCPVCSAKMDATDTNVGSKTSLPEDIKQTVLDSFMKGSED